MIQPKYIALGLLIFIQFSGHSQDTFSRVTKLNLSYNAKISDKTSTNNSLKLDKTSWLKYGFDVLQKFYEHESSDYKISGQIELEKNKLLLIERNYSEENNQWLCMLNENNKIIDWLEIAYDNSEGCCSTESIIYKDSVTVKKYSIYTKPEIIKKVFLITKEGFKPKAKYLVMAKNGLTVRAKPSLGSEKIGKLPLGLQVNILKETKKYLSVIDNNKEIDGSWIKIAIKNDPIFITNEHSFGYVFSGFLEEKDKVLKMLSGELSKFPELDPYSIYTKKYPFFIQGDFFGDEIEDLAIKATTKEDKTHIIFINKGKTNITFKILGVNDALKTIDYSWAGIFMKVDKGETLWSNYEDDWIEFKNVPENKKVKLNYDAIFVHADESCGGGFIFWKDGKFNWLQQE